MAIDRHQKYRDEILKKFHVDKGGVIDGYPNPSPAEIRNACKYLYNTNCKGLDRVFLKNFLGAREDEISDVSFNNINLYKRIQRFLLEKSKKPQGKNSIEIVAWLVDFSPRPLSRFITGDVLEAKANNGEDVFPGKIEQILRTLGELSSLAESFQNDAVIRFAEANLNGLLESIMNKWGEDQMKPMLNNIIDDKFVALEGRLKKAMRLNKRMGLLGLFFVPTMKIESIKELILDDLLDRISDIYNYDFVIDDNGDIYLEEVDNDDLLDDLV
ncbi:MAG: hypothetical protein ABJN84_08940 [Flavobacteriaceae bacterium]